MCNLILTISLLWQNVASGKKSSLFIIQMLTDFIQVIGVQQANKIINYQLCLYVLSIMLIGVRNVIFGKNGKVNIAVVYLMILRVKSEIYMYS